MIVERRPQAVPGRPLLELRNVSRGFVKKVERHRSLQEVFIRLFSRHKRKVADFWPLRDVSFRLDAGEAIAIIGPNGSGKSTLLKLITGILIPSAGTLRVNARISSLLELGAGFQPDLTGRENIYLNGSIYGLSRAQMDQRLEQIIDYAELGDFIDTPVKHYSSGMFMRLGFAVAIYTDPELLLVDEVLAVGDTAFQQKCLRSIQEFRDRGGALLFVSHDLDTVQRICKRAIWLENGEIQAEGHPTDVVMAYTKHVARKDAQKKQAKPAEVASATGRRWGSGDIHLSKVELLDDNLQPATVVHSGDAVTVRIHYAVKTSVEDPVFGLAVYHQDGTHITGPNTRFSDLRLPRLDTDGVIDYHIPALPLLTGHYALSIAVVNSTDSETYDYLDRLHHFQVYPGAIREQYGMFTLGGEWRIHATNPSPVDAGKPIVEGSRV